MHINEINKLIKSSELPSILDQDILFKIAEICKIKTYKKNTVVYYKGKKVTKFLINTSLFNELDILFCNMFLITLSPMNSINK